MTLTISFGLLLRKEASWTTSYVAEHVSNYKVYISSYLQDLMYCIGPMLIGSEAGPEEKSETNHPALWRDLPQHHDEDQVQLDVNRAFVHYPNGEFTTTCPQNLSFSSLTLLLGESEREIGSRKSSLSDLIVQVLREHPMLCYFQGYHDIVQVVLLVLGDQLAPPAVARISLLRIRDYMLPSLTPSLCHLQIIPALLRTADPELGRRLSRTQPFFALAATLTLYAHDIQEYSDIARLYDFILAHEPVVAIYLFTAIVMSRREELLEIPIEEPEMLHFTLSKLPQPLDLEYLISRTMELFTRHQPQTLPDLIWWKISSYSVLKTFRNLKEKQSLKTGELLFVKQAAQLERDELLKRALKFLWRHRRPATSITLTVLAGFMSFWLTRNGYDRILGECIVKLKSSFHF
jgi:TBC1 domain family member 20